MSIGKLKKEAVEDVLKLSTIQEGMLFHYLEDIHANLYAVQLSFWIDGSLDLDILQEAFYLVQANNEVLRSVFRWRETKSPVQIILKTNPLGATVTDLSAELNADEVFTLVERVSSDARMKRFDLSTLPLRLDFIKASPDKYVLNITYHHILFDGWSNGVLLKELFHYYDALMAKQVVRTLRKPKYKEIQQLIRSKAKIVETSTYWSDYLAGYDIKSFYAESSAVAGVKGKLQQSEVYFPAERLEDFARKNSVTKAAVIYAAYGLLLQRYCDTGDIVFGTTVANRDAGIPGMDTVVGNFISTIPLRVQTSRGSSLLTLIKDVNTALIKRTEYSHTSYFGIKKMLRLKPHENLFDSIVVIENYPFDERLTEGKGDYRISLRSNYESTDMPLVLTAFFQTQLKLVFSFQDLLFSKRFIESFAHHLIAILEAMVTDPATEAERLCILSSSERDQLLKEFNDTALAIDDAETLVTLFADRVRMCPEKIALSGNGFQFTFGELNARSNQLARHLIRRGIRKGDVVGLLLPRKPEMFVSILAVLKSGCTYVPIDPGYPIERINYIVADSNLSLLLTAPAMSVVFSRLPFGIETVDVTDHSVYGEGDVSDLEVSFASSEGAYLIYTSGSTGQPKGILIEHKSVVNYVRGIVSRINLGADCSMLCLTTISFDIFVTESILPMLSGFKVVLANEEEQRSPKALSELIITHAVNTLQITPSHLGIILESAYSDCLQSVHTVMVGGEAFPGDLLKELKKLYTGRIFNMYGPTETTVWSTVQELTELSTIDIGKPICNTSVYILDGRLNLQPVGVPGQLYIGGLGLARGYVNNELLTRSKFIMNPYKNGERIYATGDRALWLATGDIKLVGRMDNQVKIHGFRIELGEIEHQLIQHSLVAEAVVVVKQYRNNPVLVAYYVSTVSIGVAEMKAFLAQRLPDYMIPAFVVRLERMPLTPNGKIDRNALPMPVVDTTSDYVPPSDETEQKLVSIWSELLGLPEISVNKNFFDMGGDSLKLITASNRIREVFNKEVFINDLFAHSTISSLAQFIDGSGPSGIKVLDKVVLSTQGADGGGDDIAIIGIAGRFPQCANTEEFWEKLRDGVDLISRREGDAGASLVYAKGILEAFDHFDASFFDYIPSEVTVMDPQIRVFHECVYEAIESAGYNPYRYEGRIGLYGGASLNPYANISASESNSKDWIEKWEAVTYADKDFMCPRISYKLNLRGPSVTISTACSTSLVAVDRACDDLLSGRCDIAVAGGISITMHDNNGYFYQKGMIMSSDGRCRAFDEKSDGTVGGNGGGVVVLKKLKDALESGDVIHAVIKGSAVNNDGNAKVGFTAPSIKGQAEVIRMAIKNAGIERGSISYVETHGTGTALGDPIEVAALTQAFDADKKKYCAIGSVKTNIGHLDAAAGIAGLIKTVYALKHKLIPPSLHFSSPNAAIDFDNTPFYVNSTLRDWERGDLPRRAGVSSFGIGGTNAHVILEESPERYNASDSRAYQLLTVTGKTENSLAGNLKKLRHFLAHTNENLADVAYTLQVGREHFPYRRMVVCSDKQEAIGLIDSVIARKTRPLSAGRRKVVFMFPGVGSQYKGMCGDLYNQEPYFRTIADVCFDLFVKATGVDLKAMIFSAPGHPGEEDALDQIRFAHPSIFIMEYALARLLIHWGIKPDYMIGHSIGEYAAACISGVFSLEDALHLVIRRSQLIHHVSTGKMLGVSMPVTTLTDMLTYWEDLSLAAVNSQELCVVSGSESSIIAFQRTLEKEKFSNQLIRASHASHSYLMDEILKDYEREFADIKIKRQEIPFISNLTGKPADDAEIVKPSYWVKHLRHTVKFSDGIEYLLSKRDLIFTEVGPGNVLGTFVRANKKIDKCHSVADTVRHAHKNDHDLRYLLTGVGKLWQNGVDVDWKTYYENERRLRTSIPTYAFDQVRYPVNVSLSKYDESSHNERILSATDSSKWFHVPSWEISPLISGMALHEKRVNVILTDECGIGSGLREKFTALGERVFMVRPGTSFNNSGQHTFSLNHSDEHDYKRLLKAIGNADNLRITFAWGVCKDGKKNDDSSLVSMQLEKYFYSLLYITKALASEVKASAKIDFVSITNNAHYVLSGDVVSPEKVTIIGALKVIQEEHRNITCRNIDIEMDGGVSVELIDRLFYEMHAPHDVCAIAYRRDTRFIETFKPLQLPAVISHKGFVSGGVYLITGGTGGIGLSLARCIARDTKGVKFILLSRREVPKREAWVHRRAENPDGAGYDILESFQEIERLGGEIHHRRVDLADGGMLRTVLHEVQRDVGSIRGVIHAAGIADYAGIIYNRKKEENEKVFASKIYGTILLHEILLKNNLDFFVLCSSLSSVVPVAGQVGYVAANAFLNSFSRYVSTDHKVNSISIGWNAWRDVGFARQILNGGEAHEAVSANSISPDEGYEIFKKALALNLPESIISKFDVSSLIARGSAARNAMKESDDEIAEGVSDNADGTDSTESRMMRMWQRLLGISTITADDDFFELGGNSLKVLTMIGRIQKAFNVAITVKAFFNHSTLRALSMYVAERQTVSGRDMGDASLQKAELKKYYPLSAGQKRLYFIYEFNKLSLAYNIPVAYRIEGNLDRDRLHRVFKKLIANHDSLRTSIHIIDNKPVQRIWDDVPFAIEYFVADAGDVTAVLQSFVRPFDLAKAPLLRAGIVETGPGENILLMDMHHIISDGLSEGVLMAWFKAIYNDEVLPLTSLQYPDYAEWQQSAVQQQRIQTQKEFWLGEFREEVKMLDLPTDFPRPPVLTFDGNTFAFTLSRADTDMLKHIAEQEKVTMFMLLLSLFNILLSKLGDQEDIVVGTPVANRPHADFEGMIGMFVNTLALRNTPRGELIFKEFLSAVKTKTLACFDNQSYPYEDLIEELKLARDTSRNALFNAVFVLHGMHSSEFDVPGLTFHRYAIENATAKFDITLKATETGEGLLLEFEYSTSLFKRETIERFAVYFKNIVAAITEDTMVKIAAIGLMSEEEERESLFAFNRVDVSYPKDQTITALFAEQVKRTPENIAVKFGDETITYRELSEKAGRIAMLLRQHGVARNSIVGLLIDRSIDTIAGMLGILEAGGAYLPIDPDYPDKRIQYIIEDSGINVLLTTAEIKLKAAYDVVTLSIDDSTAVVYHARNAETISYPSDLCYVIYTSGTTGNPKGVMVEHRNVVRLFFNDAFQFEFGARDVWTMFHSHCFDFSVWEIFGALLFGGKLIVISKMAARDTQNFLALLADEGVTVLNQTPSAFYNLAQADLALPARSLALRYIVFGGEALSPGMLKGWRSRYPHVKLINMYGITETTVHVTYKEIGETEIEHNIGSIGMPIPTLSLYIFDKYQKPVPRGVIGELYVGGEGVARGYLGKPDLTRQRFVSNPYNPNERLYRSGDLGRVRGRGDIEYLGRMDDQIQLRGFRIELGEIKSQLNANPNIQESVVVAKDVAGSKCLVVYYVGDETLTTAVLRRALSEKLPEYMIPSYFVRMDKLPLTSNGKVDRKALPEPILDDTREYIAPLGELEEKLVEIWSVILKTKKEAISTKKSFFELGGDSIKIMRLHSLINEKLQVQISVPDLFRYTSVSALADFMHNGNDKLNGVKKVVVHEVEEMQSTLSKFVNISE